jgi:hypothetical protein
MSSIQAGDIWKHLTRGGIMTFLHWLESQKDEAESTEKLFDHIKKYNIDFSKDPKSLKGIKNAIDQIEADEIIKENLKMRFTKAFDTFSTEMKKNQKTIWDHIYTGARLLVLIGIVIFLMLLLKWAFFGDDNLRNEFYNIEFARGVITFLFAVGTIGSALIIILSIFTSEKGLEESKERFYRAKEILTILIGILGTIVGFYFGTMDDQSQTSAVELAEIKITEKEITPGESFNIISSVKGGFAPYTYSIYLEKGDTIKRIVKDQKTEQLIFQEITIPTLDGEMVISIDVKDAKGTLTELSKKITAKVSSE